MRHRNKGKIFHREKDQRQALMKSLASALFAKKRITTTVAKAKALRPFVEHLITHAKEDSLAKKRLIAKRLSPAIMKTVLSVAKEFQDRKGGYTRVVKLGQRKSDSSRMALIEFIK